MKRDVTDKNVKDSSVKEQKERLSEEIILLVVRKMRILGRLNEFHDAIAPIFKKINTKAEKTTNKHKNG